VNDDRLRALPRFDEAVQILVMVERIAAGPVDEPDVGIGHGGAVEFEGAAWVEQHVGDARDGYEVGHSFLPCDRDGHRNPISGLPAPFVDE
jgi:hypothetical protein